MTYNGAKGKTQAAMAKTLNVRALITEMTLMSQKMFKELVNKFSGISCKMSLGAIIFIIILGVYNLPGSTVIFINRKLDTDKDTSQIQYKLAQKGGKIP